MTILQSGVQSIQTSSTRIFGVDALAKFKSMRYEMSKAENPEFSFNAVTVRALQF